MQGHHQIEHKNNRIYIYTYKVYMELRSQNLTVCIVMWVYITWEDQP